MTIEDPNPGTSGDPKPGILADGAPQDTGQPATDKKPADQNQPGDKKVEPQKRPDGLDDAFWDAEKGVKLEDLLKSHTALKAAKAEADVRAQGIPAKPEDYKLTLDAEAPEFKGLDLKLDDKDPLVAAFRKTAHEQKMTQENFDAAVKTYALHQVASANAMREAVKGELVKLGDNGKARVEAVTTALNARIGKEAADALLPMMFTANAVMAIEKLLRATGGQLTTEGDGGGGSQGKAWSEMSADEKIQAGHENQARKKAAAGR